MYSSCAVQGGLESRERFARKRNIFTFLLFLMFLFEGRMF